LRPVQEAGQEQRGGGEVREVQEVTTTSLGEGTGEGKGDGGDIARKTKPTEAIREEKNTPKEIGFYRYYHDRSTADIDAARKAQAGSYMRIGRTRRKITTRQVINFIYKQVIHFIYKQRHFDYVAAFAVH
jgi:hypothetical protein